MNKILLISISLIMICCSNLSSEMNPRETATCLIENIVSNHYEHWDQLVTESSVRLIYDLDSIHSNVIKQISDIFIRSPKSTFMIISDSIFDDLKTAKIKAQLNDTQCDTPLFISINMIKVNGRWLIDLPLMDSN